MMNRVPETSDIGFWKATVKWVLLKQVIKRSFLSLFLPSVWLFDDYTKFGIQKEMNSYRKLEKN